jgi:dTDP-4-dehydrorhamnose 3,5-epimerase
MGNIYKVLQREHSMGKIIVGKTFIDGLYIIKPTVFGDSRGYFMETYNKKDYLEAGLNMEFVQDNQSKSRKGVLRGLHFQIKHPQGKLVSVLQGEVFDVAVDLRKGSETYGKWYGITLTGDSKTQFYVPSGFAHGFVVLSEEAVFSYKCTDYYRPEEEGGIIWDDPDVGIKWPLEGIDNLIMSDKDKNLKTLKEIGIEF